MRGSDIGKSIAADSTFRTSIYINISNLVSCASCYSKGLVVSLSNGNITAGPDTSASTAAGGNSVSGANRKTDAYSVSSGYIGKGIA